MASFVAAAAEAGGNALVIVRRAASDADVANASEAAAAAPKRSGGKGGGKPGRKNWTEGHVTVLLELVKKYKPTGAMAWTDVADLLNTKCGLDGEHARNGLQCKEKFNQLQKLPPTGSQALAEIKRNAIHVNALINASCDIMESSLPPAAAAAAAPALLPEDLSLLAGLEDELASEDPLSSDDPDIPLFPLSEAAQARLSAMIQSSPPAAASSASATPAVAAPAGLLSPAPGQSRPSSVTDLGSPRGQRSRIQLETVIKAAAQQDNNLQQTVQAMAGVMAQLAASMQAAEGRAQAAEARAEAAAQRHEALMAMLMSKLG
jgi:hypothetical protein